MLAIEARQCVGEFVRVTLAPNLAIADDIDTGALHLANRDDGRIILRLLEVFFSNSPQLRHPHARHEVAELLTIDEPVGLRITADRHRREKLVRYHVEYLQRRGRWLAEANRAKVRRGARMLEHDVGTHHREVAIVAPEHRMMLSAAGAAGGKEQIDRLPAHVDALLKANDQRTLLAASECGPIMHPRRAEIGIVLGELEQRRLRGFDQRMRAPEVGLILMALGAHHERRKVGRLFSDGLFIQIERAACRADAYRGGLTNEERRQPRMVERILEARDAFMRWHFVGQSAFGRAMFGDDDFLLDENAFGAGAAHPPGLPIVDDGVFVWMKQHQDLLRRLALRARQDSRPDEMRADVASGGVIPKALHPVSTLDTLNEC